MKRLSVAAVAGILIAVCSSALASVSSNAGKLLITEAAMKMKEANDWLELYVVDNMIDWSGTRLWYSTTAHYDLPAADYSAVSYIVLHQETGTDNTTGTVWHLYSALGPGLTSTDDLFYLNDSGSGQTRNVIDVLTWANYDKDYYPSGIDANNLAADGLWDDDYDFKVTDLGAWGNSDDIGSGQSLARYLDPGSAVYVDNNSRADWYRSTSPSQGGENDLSLPVTLSSFTAIPTGDHIILRWTTQSEVDNLGFNLYRSLSAEGPYERLNEGLIEGMGTSPVGRHYAFIDKDVTRDIVYFYKLEDIGFDGTHTLHGPVQAILPLKGLPPAFRLGSNFPNPFNAWTIIPFQVPGSEGAWFVTLDIVDVDGQHVRKLIRGLLSGGEYTQSWDGRDDQGREVGSGIYLYRLSAGSVIKMQKMMLVR